MAARVWASAGHRAWLRAGMRGWWPRRRSWQRAPQTHHPARAADGLFRPRPCGCGVRHRPAFIGPKPPVATSMCGFSHSTTLLPCTTGVLFLCSSFTLRTRLRGTRDPPSCYSGRSRTRFVLCLYGATPTVGVTLPCTSTLFSPPCPPPPPYSTFVSSPPSFFLPQLPSCPFFFLVVSFHLFFSDSASEPVTAGLPRPDHARCPPGDAALLHCTPSKCPAVEPPQAASPS